MNTSKSNSYAKLLVFFLIVAILIFAFGFVADGWQSDTDPDTDNGNIDNNDDNKSDEADENTDGNRNETDKPQIYIPEYVNYLTGLEITEEISKKRHTSFVMDPTAAMYGISSADVVVELPIENGKTRLLVFTADISSLGKIGAIAPTRGYISNIAKCLGATIVSNGNDDTKVYTACDIGSSNFDLTRYTGYHYTEYTQFAYSNGDLINAGLSNASIGSSSSQKPILPYTFTEFGADDTLGDVSAKTVVLPAGQENETELHYSESDRLYTFVKGGSVKNDMLTDKTVKFKNAFILFADTVTYENKDGVQMIMNTIGNGEGYYITDGTAMSITWSISESGTMCFYDEGGTRLTVNRGISYIGFVKSSQSDHVKIS